MSFTRKIEEAARAQASRFTEICEEEEETRAISTPASTPTPADRQLELKPWTLSASASLPQATAAQLTTPPNGRDTATSAVGEHATTGEVPPLAQDVFPNEDLVQHFHMMPIGGKMRIGITNSTKKRALDMTASKSRFDDFPDDLESFYRTPKKGGVKVRPGLFASHE